MSAIEPTLPSAAALFLPIRTIEPSKTNPRKNFDKAELDELTNSIREHGVLQPVLARPIAGNGHYELVAGERRYRAAVAAGLGYIPAMVRELTDEQALEMQVIENLQRADLHPLEEAEGYEQLMKKHGHSAEDLAAKVGKSKAYVYARLKLTALGPAARKAFYAGSLSPSIALLLARIPVPDLQAKATKEILDEGRYVGNDDKEPMSVREAKEHIHDNYMLALSQAPFDKSDVTLLNKVGACGPCPKRTGSQPELFGDVKSADVCTDPVCFGAKSQAHYARLRVAAEASGRKIISGGEAKKLLPYGEHGSTTVIGHHHLSEKDWRDAKGRTFGELAKKVGVEPILVEAPKTKALLEVIPEKALHDAMVKAGLMKKERASPAGDDGTRARAKKAQLETKIRTRIFEAIHQAYKGPSSTELATIVAESMVDKADHDEIGRLLELWDGGGKPKKTKGGVTDTWSRRAKFVKSVAALPPTDISRLILDLAIVGDVHAGTWNDSKPNRLLRVAKALDVDVAKIRREFADQAKAKHPKKKTAKPAKGKIQIIGKRPKEK